MQLNNVIAKRPNKTLYRDGDKLIKVFNNEFSKSNVLNEALNTARVEETGLNVPKLEEVTKINGKWAIIMDYIEGDTLEKLIAENPEKFDEYLEIFVETQLAIHNKKSKLLTVLNDKMERRIDESDLPSEVKYDLHTRLAGFAEHDKVLHGDFQFSNVILSPDGKVYVIDWSHATQGNASADAAMSYLLLVLSGRREMAEEYIELFGKKTGTDPHYIKSWIPIVAAAQLSKVKGKNKEMLKSFINVVDYV